MSGSGAPELDVDGRGLRIAVIASRWHEPVMAGLLGGALRALAAAGVSDPVVVRVPGAFELPVAAARLAAGGLGGSGGPGAGGLDTGGLGGARGGGSGGGATGSGVDALVALGVVVRGGTPHFEYVCQAATAGLTEVAVRTGVPVGFGVLTVDTEEQALDRAGLPGSREDKGAEAAQAAVATVRALAALSAPTTPAGFGAARR